MFTVWSKGDDRLDQHLRGFASTHECEFIAAGVPVTKYYHHGDFVLPLIFKGTGSDKIDFEALGGHYERCVSIYRRFSEVAA